MYTEERLTQAKRQRKRAAVMPAVLAGCALLLFVLGLVIRVKILAICGLILPLMAAFFTYSMYCAPQVRYVRFVNDVRTGRSRGLDGSFVSLDPATRTGEEGVLIHDVIIRTAPDDVETLYYWDDRMPFPELEPGQKVKGTSYGRYVIQLEAQ